MKRRFSILILVALSLAGCGNRLTYRTPSGWVAFDYDDSYASLVLPGTSASVAVICLNADDFTGNYDYHAGLANKLMAGGHRTSLTGSVEAGVFEHEVEAIQQRWTRDGNGELKTIPSLTIDVRHHKLAPSNPRRMVEIIGTWPKTDDAAARSGFLRLAASADCK